MKSRLSGIPFFDKVIYSPGLQFDGNVRRRTVQVDKSLKDATSNNNWVVIYWSRDVLKRSQYQGRRFSTLTGMSTSNADTRIGDIALSVNYCSSSALMLESVEEALLTFENNFAFDVDMGEFGVIRASVNNFDTGGFTKEDSATLGSLVTLSTTLTLTYPILYNRLSMDYPLYTDVGANQSDIFSNANIFSNGTSVSPINVSTGSILKISTDINDLGALGAKITLYLLNTTNVVEKLDINLDSSNTTVPSITTGVYLKVFAVESDRDIQHVLRIKNANDVSVWEGTLEGHFLYGSKQPNVSGDSKSSIVKVTVNLPITGAIVVHGIGISGVERYEVLNFSNSISVFTSYSYSNISDLFIGDGQLATYNVKVESSTPIIEKVSLGIYNYLP